MELPIDVTQLGLELGSGAVIGAIIGFAFKKVAKVIAVLVGLQLALFRWLESRGILTVQWDRLSGGLLKATEGASASTPPSWMQSVLSTLSISAGFTGGFLIGFKRG
ncbi:MAG: FUN14 domain-containing protein [Halodesulfurarchaeum sp.]